jgi:hypothetical protein
MKRTFPNLGIRVADGEVTTNRLFPIDRKTLGTLAGANASVTLTSSLPGTGMLRAYVYVVLADGTINKKTLRDQRRVPRAEQEAFEFNLIANAT